jgi:hypothetical protein
MKLSIVDAEKIIRSEVIEQLGSDIAKRKAANLPENLRFTFELETFSDFYGDFQDLYKQNYPFLVFEPEILNSGRIGPAKETATRYWGDLHFTLLTKEPDRITDCEVMERVAKWFQEQTLEGVRFRTYTPYPTRKDNGFTAYPGVISYDFELYRGA